MIKRSIICLLLRFLLIPFFIREVFQRSRVTILAYHNIEPVLAEAHFKLLKYRYNIIPLRQYIDARKGRTGVRLPPKSLVITFDDGFKENYQLKELLRKMCIPITIFLCTGLTNTHKHFWFTHVQGKNLQELKKVSDSERCELLDKIGFQEDREYESRQALSAREIEEMRDMADFQAHTKYHPVLPRCHRNKAAMEIGDSKRFIEAVLRYNVFALAYPNGDYTTREIDLAKENGYECALTIDHGFNDLTTNPFQLRRIVIRDSAGKSELIVRTAGLWHFIRTALFHRGRLQHL